MARTKASVGSKVASFKSSKARCCAAPSPSTSASSGSSERGSRSYSGGNPVCPRETPKWQRPITIFFSAPGPSRLKDVDADDGASTSKTIPKRNIIQSDSEEEVDPRPKNRILDESIELEPLTGEDSHKIEEYYSNNQHNCENGVKETETSENGVKGTETSENGVKGTETSENGVKQTGISENGVICNGNEVKGKIDKGKGKGKKSKLNKENEDSNIEKRKSVKRDLDEITIDDEKQHLTKKIKV